MVKGNNAVPNQHQHKHYQPTSAQQGNYVVRLDQPKRKQHRRRVRIAKAKKCFPRPVHSFKPTVACPTVRYNMKKRLGRGFTPEEIRAAGLTPRYAATIGVAVDARRKNISEEGLAANTLRLKSYLSKLVLYPVNHKKVQKGEASEADIKAAVQDKTRNATLTTPHPSSLKAAAEPARKLTAEETKKNIYKFLKLNISAVRFMGARMRKAQKKAEAEAKKKQ